MTDEATERQTALPIESELAEAIGALSADAFEGGIAPSPEAGAGRMPESRFMPYHSWRKRAISTTLRLKSSSAPTNTRARRTRA